MVPILGHTLINGSEEPARWLYLLHGIYGSGRNWSSVAKRLVDARPEWGVVLVDLRNHGTSTGFSAPHTLDECVADVMALENEIGRPATAVLGHSFGGKVALIRADRRPVQQVWVVDSTLRTGVPSGTAWRVLEIVRGLPTHFARREEVVDALVSNGYERGVGQWLAMNLERDAGGFRWKIDWQAVEEMLRDYFAADVWPIVENNKGTEMLFVKAVDSDSLDPASVVRLESIRDRTETLQLLSLEGGHWVNADNPDGMLQLLVERLPS